VQWTAPGRPATAIGNNKKAAIQTTQLVGRKQPLRLCNFEIEKQNVMPSPSPFFSLPFFFFFFGYKEILRQHPPEAHTPRAEAPWRATQRERL
jgi:hypothetical protein